MDRRLAVLVVALCGLVVLSGGTTLAGAHPEDDHPTPDEVPGWDGWHEPPPWERTDDAEEEDGTDAADENETAETDMEDDDLNETEEGAGMDGDGTEMGDGMEMDDGMEMEGGTMMDMQPVEDGLVVNENTDELPPNCSEIEGERTVTVRGGKEFADAGQMFTFDREFLQVETCTRLTVTFVNRDAVRHQWMVHGLPRETYPMGMFNIEVNGPAEVTATFVTPGEDTVLQTHCSLPQHDQKGMRQFVVVGEPELDGE